MDPDPALTPDPTPFFSDFKDAKNLFFSYNIPTGTLSSHYPEGPSKEPRLYSKRNMGPYARVDLNPMPELTSSSSHVGTYASVHELPKRQLWTDWTQKVTFQPKRHLFSVYTISKNSGADHIMKASCREMVPSQLLAKRYQRKEDPDLDRPPERITT